MHGDGNIRAAAEITMRCVVIGRVEVPIGKVGKPLKVNTNAHREKSVLKFFVPTIGHDCIICQALPQVSIFDSVSFPIGTV